MLSAHRGDGIVLASKKRGGRGKNMLAHSIAKVRAHRVAVHCQLAQCCITYVAQAVAAPR